MSRLSRLYMGILFSTLSLAVPACNQPGESALQSCLQTSDHAQTVSLTTSEGEKETGAILGDGDIGIVLENRMTGNACDWLAYARSLRDQGRSAILFPLGQDALGDVVAAAGALRQHGATKMVLIGESVGATASLIAAGVITPRVAGVVSVSGETHLNWSSVNNNLDALTAVKTLTVPVLFLAARDDRTGGDDFAADAQNMFAACPSPDKQIDVLPGNEHGEPMLHGTSGKQASAILEDFIKAVTATT